eukprot:2877234-Rhodomonas_salina.2
MRCAKLVAAYPPSVPDTAWGRHRTIAGLQYRERPSSTGGSSSLGGGDICRYNASKRRPIPVQIRAERSKKQKEREEKKKKREEKLKKEIREAKERETES